MVHDRLWAAAGLDPDALHMDGDGDYLCIGCLEARIGRRLGPGDFTGAPVNDPHPWNTPRLAARLG
jgi:hypothetical protein